MASITQNEETMNSNMSLADFELKKHRPGCTGMFWRSDPTGTTRLIGNDHWPRDGAIIRGETIVHNGEKWLKAIQVKQKGGQWNAAPQGAFMPFEYDDHYYLEAVNVTNK